MGGHFKWPPFFLFRTFHPGTRLEWCGFYTHDCLPSCPRVIAPFRNLGTLACALHAVQSFVLAQATTAESAGASLPANVAALLASQPQWSISTELETAYGFKDNLLLSSTDEERSAFVRGGVEMLLF